MRVAIASRDITPEMPLGMLGYGDRDHNHEGIHDRLYLYATAILQADKPSIIMITADLCLFGPACVRVIKETIAQRTGVSTDSLSIQTTHTHSGPDVYNIHMAKGIAETAYYELLIDRMGDAVQEAMQRAIPATMELRRGSCYIGVNRRGLDKAIDPRLFLLSVKDLQGKDLGMLFYYSCHLTVLGVDNYLVSSDWIGPVRDHFQKKLDVPMVFIQGVEGNVDPKTRGVLDMGDPDQAVGASFEDLNRISQEMIGCLDTAMATTPIGSISRVRAIGNEIQIPLRFGPMTKDQLDERIFRWKEGFARFLGVDIDSVPENHSINEVIKKRSVAINSSPQETMEQVIQQFTYTQFLSLYRYHQDYIDMEKGVARIPMRILDFGPFALVGLPVEPLVEANFDLSKRFSHKHVVICGLFDGYFGYLPHPDNYTEENSQMLYETISSVFAPHAMTDIIDSIVSALQDTR
jgi:hypothetical protein